MQTIKFQVCKTVTIQIVHYQYIENLIIADGKTTEIGKAGAGAGIRTDNYTELIVENSTFINNTVSGRGGGAIYSGYNSKATIINSKNNIYKDETVFILYLLKSDSIISIVVERIIKKPITT